MSNVWTATPTWTASLPISTTLLNQLVGNSGGIGGNLDFLYNRFPVQSALQNADKTTTSTTFVDMDATNLILTITPATGNVIVIASATISLNNTGNVYLDIIRDSTTRYGSTNGAGYAVYTVGQIILLTIIARFTGLSNASHTFKLSWRQDGAGATATAKGSAAISMMAWESN